MTSSGYPAVRVRRWRRMMRLRTLGYASYREYLAAMHWQRVKARYRASDHPQDCICGETEHLQLHHLTYDRIGAEELSDLTLLCGSCHQMIHALERRGELGLDFAGFVNAERAEQHRLKQEAKVVEWPDEFERLIAAMGRLRGAVEAVPQPIRRRVKRNMWQMRRALDNAERQIRRQGNMAWGEKPWPDDLPLLSTKELAADQPE